MSIKLIVRNLPPNLSQGSFISAFSELRGFLNGSLLISPQNELYGIIDFANYDLADQARKSRSNFKFPGTSYPIIIDFFKPQESYEYASGPSPSPINMSMGTPQSGINLQGQPNQGPFMQQRFPGDNQANNQMFNMMSQLGNMGANFPFQGVNPMNMGSKPLMQPTINSNLTNLNDPNLQNFPLSPMNNPMSSFSQMLGQMPFNPNPQQFNGPMGGPNPNFQGNMPNRPFSNDDIVMFKTPSKATSSIYVDGVPIDANEREVAHIFRPYPGFKEVRLIRKENKVGRKFYFCFVDFENALQATIALHTLQGYKFDKNDKQGVKITYAVQATHKSNQNRNNNNNKYKRRV